MTQDRGAGDMLARSPGVVLPPEGGKNGYPDADDFAKILQFGDDRIERKPEDYYAFRMIVSSDGVDSFFTHPDPKTSLVNYADDLKRGQSLLSSHKTDTLSYGVSYDGELMAADPQRHEYEASFFRRYADRADAATQTWAIGKYAIPRGMTVNGQNTDDLIRGIQMGAIRRVSISFTVGRYICDIDQNDMIAGFFGPEGAGECRHMPGVDYKDKGGLATALMVDNDLHETSLVFKNSSPSAMFLRKAEVMAQRGMIREQDIVKLEERMATRLPRHERGIWTPAWTDANTNATVTLTVPKEAVMPDERHPGHFHVGLNVDAEDIKGGHGVEYEDVPGDETEDPESAAEMLAPGILEQMQKDAEAPDEAAPEGGDVAAKLKAKVKAAGPDIEAPDPVTTAVDPIPAPKPEPAAEPEPDAEPDAEPQPELEPAAPSEKEGLVEPDGEAHPGHYHDADTKGGHFTKKPEPFEGAAEGDKATEPIDVYGPRKQAEQKEADRMVEARAMAKDVLGRLSAYETRDKEIAEHLGEPVTVEAVSRLSRDAKLGRDLFAAEVDKAVKARIAVDGEAFNAEKWRALLTSSRDIELVQTEIESWSKRRGAAIAPGRQVTPSPLPEKKAAATAPRAEHAGGNILETLGKQR
jgi:hypothetical protein